VFIAQAHSFVQQARLAVTLSWVAGYTNIITVLTCAQVTSHMSGISSELGRAVASGVWAKAGYAGLLLVVFVIGAALSAALIEYSRRKRWASIYVLPMAVEAGLLAAFALLVELRDAQVVVSQTWQGLWHEHTDMVLMTCLPAMAMGLQNATITRISGGVVRTTHVTGVLTDLGTELTTRALLWRGAAGGAAGAGGGGAEVSTPGAGGGAADAGRASTRRVLLLGSVAASFALGAGLGTAVFAWTPTYSMIPPVVFLLWIIAMDLVSPIAEMRMAREVAGLSLEDLAHELAVFHVRTRRAGVLTRPAMVHEDGRTGRGGFGLGDLATLSGLGALVKYVGRSRMPNLLAWAEHLPPHVHAVVLDLAEAEDLDRDAAVEIRELSTRLHKQGRSLVLAGLNQRTYLLLESVGVVEALGTLSLCADLELAVARALALLAEAHDRRGRRLRAACGAVTGV
jgi:uncharacterized membrane protein YoaK (UPF0700 family)